MAESPVIVKNQHSVITKSPKDFKAFMEKFKAESKKNSKW